MEQERSLYKAEWITLAGLFIHISFAGFTFLISGWNKSQATLMETWHLLGGTGIWFALYLHLRQKRLAVEEDIDTRRGRTFEEEMVPDTISAKHRLYQLEKWFLPLMTLFIALCFIVASIILLIYPQEHLTLLYPGQSMAFLGGMAFVSYIFSKYISGLSSHSSWYIISAGGSYLFSNAIFLFAIVITIALCTMEFPVPEWLLATVIPILIGIIGVEFIVNLILDLYRPRIKGQIVRPPYDSRILELLTGKSGLLKTAAHTLDYQFGFKVSQTWFWQFMEKALAPLILFQLIVLYLTLSVVVIEPHEEAILERFGQYKKILEPGLHFKWPWPVDIVYRCPVRKIQIMNFGEKEEEEGHSHGRHKQEKEKAVLYSQDHSNITYMLLIAQKSEGKEDTKDLIPLNIVNVNINLYFKVKDIKNYIYNHASENDARALLEGISYRELTQFAVNSDLMAILGPGHEEAERELKERIQKVSDRMGLGVEILLIGIKHTHPPISIFDSFEAVSSAMEEKETRKLEALREHSQKIISADAGAIRTVEEAKIESVRKGMTEGEAEEFEAILNAFQVGGKIYLTRKYLKIIEEYTSRGRIYILNCSPGRGELTQLNMEDILKTGVSSIQEGTK